MVLFDGGDDTPWHTIDEGKNDGGGQNGNDERTGEDENEHEPGHYHLTPTTAVHLFTIASINRSVTLMPVLMTYHLMSHITPPPQLSHASALAAKPNRLTFIWIILLLSTCPVALYLPTRYLSFHVDSHSALHHDISTGRKFQPRFTTSHDACD